MLKHITCYTAIAVLAIIGLTRCETRPSEFSGLLEKAELLIESRPDSAMILINSLFYHEEKLNREQCMHYIVSRAQARHENHLELTLDTLIFDAARYYSRDDNNPRLKALAYLYSGYTCYERGDHKQAADYFKKSGIYSPQENPQKTTFDFNEQSVIQANYQLHPGYDLEQIQGMYNTRHIRSQQRTVGLNYILFIGTIALFFISNRLLKEKNGKHKMADNIDTLRKTTNDLLQANKDSHHNTFTIKEMRQWKFNVMKETIQLKYQVPEKVRKENQIILDRFNKIVFDQNHEEPFTELLSMIDYCYPRLQALIEDRYPTLSEKERHICYLTLAGLSVKEISALLHQSENSIYKVRSAMNKKIGDNFCSILKEEYIKGHNTSGMG